jgi:hypothetical protein
MSARQDVGHRVFTGLHDLRAVRDEIVLQMHLLRMEGRTAWDKLTPRLDRARGEIDAAGGRLLRELRRLRDLWPRQVP